MRCYDLTGSESFVLGELLRKAGSPRPRPPLVVRILVPLVSQGPGWRRVLTSLWSHARRIRA